MRGASAPARGEVFSGASAVCGGRENLADDASATVELIAEPSATD
jgi:hypothetical protein